MEQVHGIRIIGENTFGILVIESDGSGLMRALLPSHEAVELAICLGFQEAAGRWRRFWRHFEGLSAFSPANANLLRVP